VLGEGKEQWLVVGKYTCVHCHSSFLTRDQLVRHYDSTRHDKYSAWK
jgi:hypothetical protein